MTAELGTEDGTALVAYRDMPPRLVSQPRPVLRDREALLRVVCVGLCRTDLLVAARKVAIGKPSVVLGHEFCGVLVEATGPCDVPPGKLVAVDPTFGRADGSDGFMGREIDGCLATWAVVPAHRIYGVPPDVTPRQAAYLEPVAAAMGGVDALDAYARPGKLGVLVGRNRIASLTAMLLDWRGVAYEHLSHDELREGLATGHAACRYDWMLESMLTPDMLSMAAEALKARGTLILKSRHAASTEFPAMRWAEKQLSLVGRSRAHFPDAMAWLADNAYRVSTLLGPCYRLDDWQSAFAAAEGGETGKVFVVPPGGPGMPEVFP